MRNAAIYSGTHITFSLRIRIFFFLSITLHISTLYLYRRSVLYISVAEDRQLKISFVAIKAFTSPIKILFREGL